MSRQINNQKLDLLHSLLDKELGQINNLPLQNQNKNNFQQSQNFDQQKINQEKISDQSNNKQQQQQQQRHYYQSTAQSQEKFQNQIFPDYAEISNKNNQSDYNQVSFQQQSNRIKHQRSFTQDLSNLNFNQQSQNQPFQFKQAFQNQHQILDQALNQSYNYQNQSQDVKFSKFTSPSIQQQQKEKQSQLNQQNLVQKGNQIEELQKKLVNLEEKINKINTPQKEVFQQQNKINQSQKYSQNQKQNQNQNFKINQDNGKMEQFSDFQQINPNSEENTEQLQQKHISSFNQNIPQEFIQQNQDQILRKEFEKQNQQQQQQFLQQQEKEEYQEQDSQEQDQQIKFQNKKKKKQQEVSFSKAQVKGGNQKGKNQKNSEVQIKVVERSLQIAEQVFDQNKKTLKNQISRNRIQSLNLPSSVTERRRAQKSKEKLFSKDYQQLEGSQIKKLNNFNNNSNNITNSSQQVHVSSGQYQHTYILNKQLLKMQQIYEQSCKDLEEENLKTKELSQQIQNMYGKAEYMQKSIQRTQKLNSDYQVLLEHFQKSEFIKSQQKQLIDALKKEIKHYKNENNLKINANCKRK